MLEIKELTKYYGKNLAVDQVTFTVPNGQVGVLLGPNGSGKSTIIKSIAGLLRYQGEIRIKGIPARQIPARKEVCLCSGDSEYVRCADGKGAYRICENGI